MPLFSLIYNNISLIADILSVGSFIVSVALWVLFGRFKRQYEAEKTIYNKEYKLIYESLCALRENLFTDNMNNERLTSDMRLKLYSIDRSFRRLFSIYDRAYIWRTLGLLKVKHNDINLHNLRIKIDYLIPLFERKNKDA